VSGSSTVMLTSSMLPPSIKCQRSTTWSFSVCGAERIDDSLAAQTDSIDDQRIAFVAANRFAVIAGLGGAAARPPAAGAQQAAYAGGWLSLHAGAGRRISADARARHVAKSNRKGRQRRPLAFDIGPVTGRRTYAVFAEKRAGCGIVGSVAADAITPRCLDKPALGDNNRGHKRAALDKPAPGNNNRGHKRPADSRAGHSSSTAYSSSRARPARRR
jgi:hypothetical protein